MLLSRLMTAQLGLHSSDSFSPNFTVMNIATVTVPLPSTAELLLPERPVDSASSGTRLRSNDRLLTRHQCPPLGPKHTGRLSCLPATSKVTQSIVIRPRSRSVWSPTLRRCVAGNTARQVRRLRMRQMHGNAARRGRR